MSDLFLLHCAITWLLVGLIWTIQVVHYPLFAKVPEADFANFHRAHTHRIGWLVGPLMLAEAASALWLLTKGDVSPLFSRSLLPLALIWLSTAWIQVPQHRRLENGYDAPTIRRLCLGNWVRTLAWTSRGVMLVWMLRSSL